MKGGIDGAQRMLAAAKRAGITARVAEMVLNAQKAEVPYRDRPLESFVGLTVETAFETADGRPECMWVEITGVEGDSLVGVLLSDPVRATDVRRGDRVELDRAQVRADHRSRAEHVAASEREWKAKSERYRRRRAAAEAAGYGHLPPAFADPGTEERRRGADASYDAFLRLRHRLSERLQ